MDIVFTIPIGIRIKDGSYQNLDLQLSDQSPHGLLGGATGSGKSELLITIMASIAAKYSPDEVNFAIIDFKSGSTSDLVRGLPHCAGTASDLSDADAIMRSLELLKAEIARRQEILNDALHNGIISKAEGSEYYAAWKRDPTLPPMPLLLLIVDEYGNLKKQYDKFADEIRTIAKQGRSRFIYLLLADSEPNVFSSVGDNVSYRICMGFDSHDKIRDTLNCSLSDTDTAFQEYFHKNAGEKLPRGRGLLRFNGETTAFQAPYARAEMPDGDTPLKKITDAAKIKYTEKGLVAYRVLTEQLPGAYYGNAERFFRGYDLRTGQYGPNPDWNIPIGLLDDLSRNQKTIYTVNPRAENILFIGNKGAGKTWAVKNLLFNLVNRVPPEQCNIYIFNFGGAAEYRELEMLPHVGSVLDLGVGGRRADVEKLRRSESVMRSIIAAQSSRMGGERKEYIVVIDGYKYFSDSYPMLEMRMRTLISEGKSSGLSFLVTSTRSRFLPDVVRSAFQTQILMRSAEDEAAAVFGSACTGKTGRLIPGRAIIADDDGRCLHMQMSFPGCVAESKFPQAVADYLQSYYCTNRYRAAALPHMPEVITLDMLHSAAQDMSGQLYIGMGTENLKPVHFGVQTLECLLIEGTSRSGKSHLFSILLAQLRRMRDQVSLLVFDNEKGQHAFPDTLHDTCVPFAQVCEFVRKLDAFQFEEGKDSYVMIEDYHALYLKLRSESKALADSFCHWIEQQRSSESHVHFVIAYAAEANAYEIFPNFRKREAVLLGTKQSWFAVPDLFKREQRLPEKHHAFVCTPDELIHTKLINRTH